MRFIRCNDGNCENKDCMTLSNKVDFYDHCVGTYDQKVFFESEKGKRKVKDSRGLAFKYIKEANSKLNESHISLTPNSSNIDGIKEQINTLRQKLGELEEQISSS